MTRVITLGSAVAVGGGAFLGITLAYQLVPLAVLAALVGLAGIFVVVRAIPEPAPVTDAPIILSGPLARPAITEESDTESEPVPVQQLPVPVVAVVPDAA